MSERSDFLREMFGRHLGFFRQRKVGERKKILPRGWLVGKRKEGGGGVACPNPHPAPSNRKSNMAAQWTIALALPNKTPALQAMIPWAAFSTFLARRGTLVILG